MRNPKFSIGQNVCIIGSNYSADTGGKIIGITTIQTSNTTPEGAKIRTKIVYNIKCNKSTYNYTESKLFASKNALFKYKRSKAKSGAKSSITRLEKTSKKNEDKLAMLQEKLARLDK